MAQADVPPRSPRSVVRAVLGAHVAPELGGDEDLLPPLLESLPEQGLAPAPVAVDVGGVDEGPGLVEPDPPAEVVPAEPTTETMSPEEPRVR